MNEMPIGDTFRTRRDGSRSPATLGPICLGPSLDIAMTRTGTKSGLLMANLFW
jgi:hypothetical protein